MTTSPRLSHAHILERSVKYVALEQRLDEHRAALTAQCRWVLGSGSEAEDAVQETMVRAWQRYADFDGRCPLQAWLRRIARNVCFDMLRVAQRRARPADPAALTPERAVAPADDDPAERAVASEGVRAAFVAALVHLPARQRSVLLLRDVLQWRSSEVADLLGITVPSVNSALQRARANVRGQDRGTARPDALDDDKRAQLHGYVQALESLDVAALTGLLRGKEGPATDR
jgi:RNA polymerase sigma-70 factor (ECF subfamily)